MFGIDDFFFMLAGGAYVAGKGIKEAAGQSAAQKYERSLCYNHRRQSELEMMVHSASREKREEFMRLVGHPLDRDNWYEVRSAIREIANREGWTYFDPAELAKDQKYNRLMGARRKRW